MIRWLALLLLLLVLAVPTHAQETPPITDQNAHRLIQSDPIGRGRILELRWSPDGRWLAAHTPIGIWLMDTTLLYADPQLLRVLDQPQAFAFSSDSDMLAIAGCRGSIPELFNRGTATCALSETHLWSLDDVVTLLTVVNNGQANVERLAVGAAPFHSAPLVIASGGNYQDGWIQVANGQRAWRFDLSRQFDTIEQVVVSPDSQLLAIWGGDTVYVLDMEIYAVDGFRSDVPELMIPDEMILSHIAFADDGRTLIGRGRGGRWRWDMTQRNQAPVYDALAPIPSRDDGIYSLYSQNFQYALTRSDDAGWQLWTEASALFSEAPAPDSRIALTNDGWDYWRFSPGNHFLVLGQSVAYANEIGGEGVLTPGNIRLLETHTGALVRTFTSVGVPHRAALSNDDSKIAYLDPNHTLHIEDIDTERTLNIIPGFAGETYGVVVAPDGTVIYSSCGTEVIQGSTSTCLPSTFHSGEQTFPEVVYRAAAISSDGALLVDRQLVLRDRVTMEIVREFDIGATRAWHLAFRPDATQLAVSGEVPMLIDLTDANRDPILLDIALNENSSGIWTPAITYSPDGRWVATASFDGIGRIWDATTGELRAVLHSAQSPSSEGGRSGDGIAFSPDGVLVAFGACYLIDGSSESSCSEGRVYLYEVEAALALGEMRPDQAVQFLKGANDYTVQLVFSPDGSVLVGSGSPAGWESSASHEVVVWSARTGALLSILPAAGATEIAFSPHGRILYSNSSDGVVYRWRIDADSAR